MFKPCTSTAPLLKPCYMCTFEQRTGKLWWSCSRLLKHKKCTSPCGSKIPKQRGSRQWKRPYLSLSGTVCVLYQLTEAARRSVLGWVSVCVCVQWSYCLLCVLYSLGGSTEISHPLKGSEAWEFFGLQFWILYFFIVSYAKILRFCQKFFWLSLYQGR